MSNKLSYLCHIVLALPLLRCCSLHLLEIIHTVEIHSSSSPEASQNKQINTQKLDPDFNFSNELHEHLQSIQLTHHFLSLDLKGQLQKNLP